MVDTRIERRRLVLVRSVGFLRLDGIQHRRRNRRGGGPLVREYVRRGVAAGRPERLRLGACELGLGRAGAAPQLEMVSDRFIENSHAVGS